MRRLPILLAVGLVFALFVVAAATAAPPTDLCGPDGTKPDHPSCSDTTTLEFADCLFDPVTGVLDSWHGHVGDERQCIWNVDNPGDTFRFQIQSDPADPATAVKLPHMIVNANVDGKIVFPSFKCLDETRHGIQELPFPGDDLWTFSPWDRQCGESPYLLTISIQGLKSGSVNLVMTQTPSGG